MINGMWLWNNLSKLCRLSIIYLYLNIVNNLFNRYFRKFKEILASLSLRSIWNIIGEYLFLWLRLIGMIQSCGINLKKISLEAWEWIMTQKQFLILSIVMLFLKMAPMSFMKLSNKSCIRVTYTINHICSRKIA